MCIIASETPFKNNLNLCFYVLKIIISKVFADKEKEDINLKKKNHIFNVK